ncbi:MAG: Rne/Rng family ribonuclease [Chromatiales bacterium]|nr:Rne/Rng family ribonuclease [Chromatiales bacterium]
MKRILVNATQQEELRVAIVDGQKLYDLDIEAAGKRQKKGNIYKGIIASIAPSLDAVFVDYGGFRQGFLPTKEICSRYIAGGERRINSRRINEQLKEGQEIIVQIVREELVNKGASMSTFISLTGQYLVLMPDRPHARGISQRITGSDRRRMLALSREITVNKDEGAILRTACLNAQKHDLQKNLNYLRHLWKQIQKAGDERAAPFLIYKEASIVLQTIQNNLELDISEIIVDDQQVYEEIRAFLSMTLPHYKRKLKLYSGNIPLFNRMHIETQIESLYQHQVGLPSGGSIVLDHTEALTSIDINSSRSTKHDDLEGTALATNLEAIDEITRQLRLRDMGGLLVIDFIDMLSRSNKRKVEEYLHKLLKKDRARTRIGNISKFGLLEMSRQRLRPSLKDESQILCPRCSGRGFIRTVKSCALVVLRLIEEEAGKPNTNQVIGYIPAEVYQFLMADKSDALDSIGKRYKIQVSLKADAQIETPHYKIERYQKDSYRNDKNPLGTVSIRSSMQQQDIRNDHHTIPPTIKDEVPAISAVMAMEQKSFTTIFKNLWGKLSTYFRKETTDKSYRRKRSKYRSTKFRTHYQGQNKEKKTPHHTSSKRSSNRRKSTASEEQTQALNASTSTQPATKQKGTTHAYTKRRSYRKPRTSTNKSLPSASDQNPSRAHSENRSAQQPDTINHDSKSTKKPSLARTEIKQQAISSKPYKQPRFNNKKSNLIQVETKLNKNKDSK